jgi:hypothetical protein
VADVVAALLPRRPHLLLPGRQPALIDTGFVAHAEETADAARLLDVTPESLAAEPTARA